MSRNNPVIINVRFFTANDQLTDRRRKRVLAANPAPDKSGASKLKRLAAVRLSVWLNS
jgi:hypothetical protein